MTTGATIHTTEGLLMTVTRRPQPPIIPKLETCTQIVNGDETVTLQEDQQGEVSVAPL